MSRILTITMNPTIDVSASTPEVVPTRKLRCADVRYDPGGGGINVARVVKRLGGDCLALFPAGGSSGSFLLNLIRQEDLSGLPVEISSETRESFTVLEESSGNEFRFVLPGPPLGNRDWQSCLDYLESLADCPPYVVASGSLPPGVPDNFYMEVARITKSLGARLVIDTSEGALKHALELGVYLAKPNLQELQELTGRALTQPSEWKSAALEIVNAGKAEIVVVTLGEQGAMLVTKQDCMRAEGLSVDVVSAVGAGDSFLGALVWSLSTGADLQSAFRYGVAAGTAALLTPGTELCRKKDVERLYQQVQIHRI